MDSELIYERLKALGKRNDQEQYRDISRAFQEVIRYNRAALEELEKQLEEEIRDISDRYYLYGTVVPAGDVAIINDFLFPMCEEPAGKGVRTVFCETGTADMEELFSGEQKLVIETRDGSVEAAAVFRPCARYGRQVEKLRRIFYDNGLYWRTPYLPYIKRFADVECGVFSEAEDIKSVDLLGRPGILKMNCLPVWNVERMKKKCLVFPIPAIDEQYYRHNLELTFPQDGYAVDMDASIREVYFQNDELVLITEDKKQRDFDLYRIAVKRKVNAPHYPLTTNARRMRHVDRQAENAVRRLYTLAEIGRIAGSYEPEGGFTLSGVEEEGKRLKLTFRVTKEDFLTRDRLEFLVSEIGQYFPQFETVGEIQA